MNNTMKETKDKCPSMLAALHLNRLAGITSNKGISSKRFNCCLPVDYIVLPIIYFDTKPMRFVFEKHKEE